MRRAVAILGALALAGCTNDTGGTTSTLQGSGPAPALKLVSYQSCDELLPKLREAGKRSVGQYGFGGSVRYEMAEMAPGAARADADAAGKAAPPQQGEDFSGTNVHEQGVDEPDMVKTDGKRITVLIDNTLHVIDAATKRVTWRLPLDFQAQDLLLHGDRVLVVGHEQIKPVAERGDSQKVIRPQRQKAHAELVDIAHQPKVIGEFSIDGNYVDARQVAGTVRLVTRSVPDIAFPVPNEKGTKTDDRIAANRELIDSTGIDAWLPEITLDGARKRVSCNNLNLPEVFSGASLVTLSSFDLEAARLSGAEAVTVAADGDTVYGSGKNLYLAHDQRWRAWTERPGALWDQAKEQSRTDLLQFDITAAKPVYTASGSVPGWLLNQYSLSEHDGVLRVATTLSPPWRTGEKSSSTVFTLQRDGGSLNKVGEVGGLGKGERIYSVRFVGKTGYVVTFRQTDPLYTLDLSNPKAPKVLGELKIPGYSAYLHPVGDARLIGVGQDANDRGRVSGTQISLFDVGNLADPKRLDQFKMDKASSEAEHDPHAFLYWDKTRLLVVPVNGWEGVQTGALLLRVDDTKLTRLAVLNHNRSWQGRIRRSLVIGDALWTISQASALVTTLDGGRELAKLDLDL